MLRSLKLSGVKLSGVKAVPCVLVVRRVCAGYTSLCNRNVATQAQFRPDLLQEDCPPYHPPRFLKRSDSIYSTTAIL